MKFSKIVLLVFMIVIMAIPLLAQESGTPESIFTNLGVNMAVVGALIAFTQVVKTVIPESIRKYIVFFPMALALLYAFILGGYETIETKVTMSFLYAAAAGYLFSLAGGVISKMKK
jgi:hypothetical protein